MFNDSRFYPVRHEDAMFRTAELHRKLPKEEFHQQVPQLREELLKFSLTR